MSDPLTDAERLLRDWAREVAPHNPQATVSWIAADALAAERERRKESSEALNNTMQRVPAQWTNDCQGKQDYDGELVGLSTRYWPRGGGFHIVRGNGEWEGNETRPDILPSAHATIYLGPDEELAEFWCKADTEGEVKRRVEMWATVQFCRIQNALRKEFTEASALAAQEGT